MHTGVGADRQACRDLAEHRQPERVVGDGGSGIPGRRDEVGGRGRHETDAAGLARDATDRAGLPIGADAGVHDMVLLDRVFFSPAPDYLLRVKGDSMRDEGILSGDLIGVHRTTDARSGQIVVARIDDEITVKLLKVGKDGIRLLPRNPDFAPIVVRGDQDFAIEGLYCGLVRPNK